MPELSRPLPHFLHADANRATTTAAMCKKLFRDRFVSTGPIHLLMVASYPTLVSRSLPVSFPVTVVLARQIHQSFRLVLLARSHILSLSTVFPQLGHFSLIIRARRPSQKEKQNCHPRCAVKPPGSVLSQRKLNCPINLCARDESVMAILEILKRF